MVYGGHAVVDIRIYDKEVGMADSQEIVTMRLMAWERARGELLSVRRSFWSSDPENSDLCHKLIPLIEDFIDKVDTLGVG